jgi:hypothetical protein
MQGTQLAEYTHRDVGEYASAGIFLRDSCSAFIQIKRYRHFAPTTFELDHLSEFSLGLPGDLD